jgi:hypothetical protein
VQIYELNLEDFSDLDKKDMQEEELNTVSSNKYEDLVVSTKKINIVFKSIIHIWKKG